MCVERERERARESERERERARERESEREIRSNINHIIVTNQGSHLIDAFIRFFFCFFFITWPNFALFEYPALILVN